MFLTKPPLDSRQQFFWGFSLGMWLLLLINFVSVDKKIAHLTFPRYLRKHLLDRMAAGGERYMAL